MIVILFWPCRYALDVNAERAENVLTHKRLLHLAEDPANRPAFDVRLVQVELIFGLSYSQLTVAYYLSFIFYGYVSAYTGYCIIS